MPIYEYECTECGKVIELIQKVNARAPGRCEKCSGKLKKKISRVSFQLKGGGGYSDGYSNDGGASSTSESSSSESSSTPEKKKKDGKSVKSKTAASA